MQRGLTAVFYIFINVQQHMKIIFVPKWILYINEQPFSDEIGI